MVLPAFVPRCHRYIEDGCRFIETDVKGHFMMVSPDGIVRCIDFCDGNCKNLLQLPIGPMAMEIKCPFSGITNKEIMPVHYKIPSHYVCQVLSEMVSLSAEKCMFASCSPESLTMCYVDFSEELWDKLWTMCQNLYDCPNPKMPDHLNPENANIKKLLDDFVSENCVLAVEVPTLECIDIKTFENLENVNNPMYRFRPPYPRSQYDEKEMKHKIVECCKSSIECVRKAHDLCRRKATEVLLFLLDRYGQRIFQNKIKCNTYCFCIERQISESFHLQANDEQCAKLFTSKTNKRSC